MSAARLSGPWIPVRDGDDRARALYLRHYSASKRRRGSVDPQFVGPGGKLVLLTLDCRAVFAWRVAGYRDDGQEGIECSLFRNEGPMLSSSLIREAVEMAFRRWAPQRCFTYVEPQSIRSTNPGFCFLQAGWRRLRRRSKVRGLRLLEFLPEVVG